VGYSVGGQHVGRTLYAGNPRGGQQLEKRDTIIDKVSGVVFVNSLFGGPPEEADAFTPPTFPLTVNGRPGSDALWQMTEPVACTGRIIPGTREQVWKQTLEHDPVGSEWGGDDPNFPTGLNRAPTFSGYGWNPTVAGQLKKPTLVIQGLKDGVLPNVQGSTEQVGPNTGKAIYNSLTAAEHKVLVQIECASHVLQWEGCAEGFDPPPERCTPAGGDTLRRDRTRPLVWPPCYVQGSADRVDQGWDIQRKEGRFLHRRREWRGEPGVLRSRAVALPYGLAFVCAPPTNPRPSCATTTQRPSLCGRALPVPS
jgi:hypothetical protein